ncbi:MAG TPA: hypothetical protein VII49_01280 [Rhizomicrobium sp.]
MPAYLRRAILFALLVTTPPILTGLTYLASRYLLYATSRSIDPRILLYAAIVELLVFVFVAVLEVKDRW